MKQILTQSEWYEITDIYQNGLDEEIQSGDSSHIEDHMKIATMLNYFPSRQFGRVQKYAEDSWTVAMQGEIMEVSDEDIQGLLDDMLFTPSRFLVIPDNYTTPENEGIGASIGIYAGPSATVQEIGNTADRLTGLMHTIAEMQSRLEALEGQVSTLESDNSTLEGNVTTLTSDKEALEGQVSTLESTIGDLTTRLEALENPTSPE